MRNFSSLHCEEGTVLSLCDNEFTAGKKFALAKFIQRQDFPHCEL